MRAAVLGKLRQVNGELWLLLSIFVLAAAMNFVLDSQRMLLALYSLPAVYSAYCYGRRHATLTAIASVALIGLLMHFNSAMFSQRMSVAVLEERWYDLTIWGGVLVLTTYAMGTLYEHKRESIRELRQAYHGVLMILQQFIAKDQYTQNHSYRVSVYAAKIAEEMRLDTERIEDVRSSALLHDIGKLHTSRQILYKAARLSESELKEMRRHVDVGIQILEPVGGTLRRVLPIILAHHDKFDGSGYHPTKGEEIPLEARILSVADVYDSLTSDRPYRKAMSPFDAKEIIEKGAGTEFDPHVVKAFLSAFRKRELEVPEIVV
ncbi:MAG TPA: HD-GYP domain-containing protein [Terriglobales bacterium]|jgi:putative nucleotidyltransferase with HDIG domain|nr:HD-GYP domain-containing protein [Terriglobales bacterium]